MMVNKSATVWALVADGGRAKILSLCRQPPEWHEVHEFVSENRHSRHSDLVTDSDSRSYNVKGPGSHTKQRRSDAHDLSEQAFTRKLTEVLETAHRNGAFDQLAIISDPRSLGRIRQALARNLDDVIIAELDKDLVNMSSEQLKQYVHSVLGWSS